MLDEGHYIINQAINLLLLFFCFFSAPNLRGNSVDQHPNFATCSIVTGIYKIASEIWDSSPSPRTTLQLDREYLWNEITLCLKKWGTHIMPHNSHKCGPILIFLSL